MIPSLRFVCLFFLLVGFFHPVHAASTNSFRVVAELQDGSRVVGKSGDINFEFRSGILGELKLPLEQISSVECQPKTNSVKLKTANGDILEVTFTMKEVRVDTSFGNIKIPVDSIRRLQVSAAGMSGRTKMGLVALWSGEGNGIDAINDNTANPVGDVTFTSGKQGQAFFFNGNSAYLRIQAGSSLDVGQGGGFTIEGWINPIIAAKSMLMFEFERELGTASGSDVGLQLGIHRTPPNQIGCLFANIKDVDDGDHIFSSSANQLVPGTWQHFALTYEKASGKAMLYLNGVEVAQANLGTFTPQTSFANLLIGARTTFNSVSNPSDVFYGKMDELGIYNRALSAVEIQAICTEENNGEPLPPPTAAPRRLPFDGPGQNFISE